MSGDNTADGWWQANDGQWYPPDDGQEYGIAPHRTNSEASPESPLRDDDVQDDGDPIYRDNEGIEWWWDGSAWNCWVAEQWVPVPGARPIGLAQVGISDPTASQESGAISNGSDDQSDVIQPQGSTLEELADLAEAESQAVEAERIVDPPPPTRGNDPSAGSVAIGPPPGWMQDPDDPAKTRWWDGESWTEHVRANSEAPEKPEEPEAIDYTSMFPHPGPLPAGCTKGPVPQRLAAMGMVAGRKREEIIGVLGNPSSEGGTSELLILQWQAVSIMPGRSYHYVLLFDKNGVCGGIDHAWNM